MAFTVAEALKMEIFDQCRLLTGQAGLQNEIHWVNILEILDDLSHIEPGEFLITTAHGFNVESKDKQRNMVELFASRKLAAMAIQTGHYLESIPSSFIRFSENYSIPLIEIPPEVSFKSLTRAIMNELLRSELIELDNMDKTSGRSRLESQVADMKNLWKKLIIDGNHEGLTIQMDRHNLKPNEPVLVMDFNICDAEGKRLDQGDETTQGLFTIAEQNAAQLLKQLHIPFLIGPSDHFLTLLIQTESLNRQTTTSSALVARRLFDKLSLLVPEYTIRIGLSNVHDNIGKIKQALAEAHKAQQAAHLELMEHTNIVSLRSMNLYRLIMDTENMDMLRSIYCETAAPLVEYDQKSSGSLLETLRTYLHYCSLKKAAEVLFVHRHTMKYRLDQIEKLTGFNPLLPNDALQLNIGLHIYYYLKALKLLP